jgi:LysM repeat protein
MARNLLDFARRPFGQKRNVVYFVISGLLFFAVVVVLFYWGRAPSRSQAGTTDVNPNPLNKTVMPSLSQQTPQTLPARDIHAVPFEPNTGARPDVAAAIAEAVVLVTSEPDKIIEARDKLNSILQLPLTLQQEQFVKEHLSKLAGKWLFGPIVCQGDTLCDTYTVKAGDLLSVISDRSKVPHEILMQINGIRDPKSLQAGRTIKVIKGPFNVKVSRSTFMMDVYLQNTFVRTFPVGLGRTNMETPTGLWRVKLNGKLISPTWTDPDTGRTYKSTDPDYPLGSRWIALEGIEGLAMGRTGFAIHGTKDPEQIGTAGSRGCIRLHNGDAVLVYNLLVPGYSQVRVVE